MGPPAVQLQVTLKWTKLGNELSVIWHVRACGPYQGRVEVTRAGNSNSSSWGRI